MRDLVVREGLEAIARDAAKRFRELIAAGEEIPYEVREPGDGSPLCRYQPLTERFIRDHAGVLRELDSFGTTCAALEAADLAGPYLDELGIPAPPEARARAELATTAFLCRLWLDSTDFSLDRERLAAAIDEVELGGAASEEEIEVVVPLRGIQLPVDRLELATATIVRSDAVEAPPEARAGEVMGASPWEPTFLAVARVDAGDGSDDAAVQAAEAFRCLTTTLRLFRPGGVGLGPHAWVATGANRWRRILTGAAKPRAGGYRLAEDELAELVALSRAVAAPEKPLGRAGSERPGAAETLARAVSRFEAGLERPVVLEALNDNLLALRFLLEGAGPAGLGMPMRVAALCAEPAERAEVKAVVEGALALERELWSGEPHGGGPPPAETATRLEELARAILRDAACGHLGADLRATADEILLADGLAAGDGAGEQRGATEEWSPAQAVDEQEEGDEAGSAASPHPPRSWLEEAEEELAARDGRLPAHGDPAPWTDVRGGDAPEPGSPPSPAPALEPRIEVVKVPAGDGRSTHSSDPEEDPQMSFEAHASDAAEAPTTVIEAVPDPEAPDEPEPEADPDRVPEGSPVLRLIEQTRSERRDRADRVANLFPRPETEWNVRELGYDRRRRARVSAS